jgi:16S rRNA G966 N2-methylase RsmD
VESDSALVAQLQKTKEQLSATAVELQRGDGVACIRQAEPASCDLIFLDPPFDAPILEIALKACTKALAPSGWVYLEGPAKWTDELLEPMGFMVQKHLKAGAVHAHLLRLA